MSITKCCSSVYVRQTQQGKLLLNNYNYFKEKKYIIADNYRRISLIHSQGKVFETIISMGQVDFIIRIMPLQRNNTNLEITSKLIQVIFHFVKDVMG